MYAYLYAGSKRIVQAEARPAGALGASSKQRTSARTALRVVLLTSQGLNNTEIAARLGVHRPMVRRWRSRFAEFHLGGRINEPRPGNHGR
jgi:DNA-binding CsgD family transcriptional regulator